MCSTSPVGIRGVGFLWVVGLIWFSSASLYPPPELGSIVKEGRRFWFLGCRLTGICCFSIYGFDIAMGIGYKLEVWFVKDWSWLTEWEILIALLI